MNMNLSIGAEPFYPKEYNSFDPHDQINPHPAQASTKKNTDVFNIDIDQVKGFIPKNFNEKKSHVLPKKETQKEDKQMLHDIDPNTIADFIPKRFKEEQSVYHKSIISDIDLSSFKEFTPKEFRADKTENKWTLPDFDPSAIEEFVPRELRINQNPDI